MWPAPRARDGCRRADGWSCEAAFFDHQRAPPPEPADLMLLAFIRVLGRPVGVYFRDAYQLFRWMYPIVRRRQRLMDWLWRLSMPIMRGIATRRFVPSARLAPVLPIVDPILLPSASDP